jgi:hypothetical protein
MSDAVVGTWMILIAIVILNGCAAGVTAMLHVRRKMRRGARVMTAVLITAVLEASMFVPVAFADAMRARPDGLLVIGTIIAVVFAGALVVSLPGALVVSRKLEAPRDEYHTFE